jgi:heme oxygenase (biliverdin-IX-beta and delta-forming)
MLLTFDLSRAHDYTIFLAGHLAALASLQSVWRTEDTHDFSRLLSCLQADLSALGQSTVSSAGQDTWASQSGGFGVSYVVRGSRLGAVFLRRAVGSQLPTSYLDCALSLSWPEFLTQLESLTGSPLDIEDAARAARRTFDVFATKFSRLREANSAGVRRSFHAV